MKTFSKFLNEKHQDDIRLGMTPEYAKSILTNYIDSLGVYEDNTLEKFFNEYIDDHGNLEKNQVDGILESLNSIVTDLKVELDNLMESNVSVSENYKSDEDIEAEYKNFEMGEFNPKVKDMSHIYGDGSYEAMVEWSFGAETIGGAENSYEYFIYSARDGEFKYAVDNWYPESVYLEMVEKIKQKLKELYNKDFEKVKFLTEK